MSTSLNCICTQNFRNIDNECDPTITKNTSTRKTTLMAKNLSKRFDDDFLLTCKPVDHEA
jgi:hypothetical protein